MSKNSRDKKPYYQKYGEPAWHRNQPTFPEGRDPYTDLFKDEVIREISAIAGTLSETEFPALQANLRDVAYHFMCALFTTPLHLSDGPESVKLTARKNHLDRQIIKPANRLLDALASDNAALLSEWPEVLDYPAPDRSALINELSKLRDRTPACKGGADPTFTEYVPQL